MVCIKVMEGAEEKRDIFIFLPKKGKNVVFAVLARRDTIL